ncbi:hypothetical protein DdX_13321 [Ditylenchus destructor]|uniref:Secreted protein n=1 Tax=Ditylenchus destructor TaxID=166010 RepID=A0AAD4MU27_9BILA|nr:hypothetical protein DdX_13321 [Ditylenchus destructor]
MWIRMAALAAVFVVYLSWTDETLAAKHRDKHSRLSTLPRHHSNKNAKQNITKQDYWRKLSNLEERLAGQIRTRKKLENGLKKRRENRKGHSSRKVSEEKELVQIETEEKNEAGGPEMGHSTSTQSTALSNYTSPSTHRSSQHASQQQTHSHANGHTAEQPSTARNQQSTGQENAIGHANDLSEALDKALNVTDSDVDIAYLKKKLTALYAMTFNIEIFTENAKDPEKAKQLQQSAYRTIGDFSKTCKEDDPSCWMKLKQ